MERDGELLIAKALRGRGGEGGAEEDKDISSAAQVLRYSTLLIVNKNNNPKTAKTTSTSSTATTKTATTTVHIGSRSSRVSSMLHEKSDKRNKLKDSTY